MASNLYTYQTASGEIITASRTKKQGRKPSGFGVAREVRLYPEDDAAFRVLAKHYGEYWNASQFIRDAVRKALSNSPYAELLNT